MLKTKAMKGCLHDFKLNFSLRYHEYDTALIAFVNSKADFSYMNIKLSYQRKQKIRVIENSFLKRALFFQATPNFRRIYTIL